MNRLKDEVSPYLYQHAENPVDWYPWGDEAFEKARLEDKPVLLSIGYSTCHWCHVMAHESFEDKEVAELLNRSFVCVKVDKEERPDIDSIYMDVCTALTGSGGWPMTVIMEHTGRPFFAGTYFPKQRRFGMPGLMDILKTVRDAWENDRDELLRSAEQITRHINEQRTGQDAPDSERLTAEALDYFARSFDPRYGGFGGAPKFPAPHNLLFLMKAYETRNDRRCLHMAEKTLMQMAKGGIMDQIGFGFSRYSTDEKWLAPHFEKMLYDNALLVMAYTRAYTLTHRPLYRQVAEWTLEYIHREMTDENCGFYSAQDADSDGVEGKYYVFTPDEIRSVLGEKEGGEFCALYDITEAGNFEGKSIPNQIGRREYDTKMREALPKLYEYRLSRTRLHKDDKLLTAWNGLMIAALADAYIAFGGSYLERAERAAACIQERLFEKNTVYTSFRAGKRGAAGFIDDYSYYIFALLKLYEASLDSSRLERAAELAKKTLSDFFDAERGGFYLYGSQSERLLSRPKDTYDGAAPSGNSVMAHNLLRLSVLTGDEQYEAALERHMEFMNAQAAAVPSGHSFYLTFLLEREYPPRSITVVLSDKHERERVREAVAGRGLAVILEHETKEYRLLNGKTTYYVCENNRCLPPSNTL